MFIHNFKYSLKILLKNKMLIFWTFSFPIIMALFFYMAFNDIEKNETLDIIDIGIVNDEVYQSHPFYDSTLKSLSDEDSDNYMFNITYGNINLLDDLLGEKEIVGYLYFEDDEANLVFRSNGISESVFKKVVDEIKKNEKIVSLLIEGKDSSFDYSSFYEKMYSYFTKEVELNNRSNKNLSYTMIEYYTLIAMACLYGGTLSMYSINKVLPNMSSLGKRCSTSPISKSKMVLSSLLASFLVQILGVCLLLLFTILFLNVNYGFLLQGVILLAVVGSLAGLSLGLIVGTVIKKNENTKLGILIAVTMLGCFFSGMMGITMKYYIDKNVPLINILNPASMITDGFYALYYYNTYSRFIFDVVSLLIFSVVLIFISFLILRRQKYDSI